MKHITQDHILFSKVIVNTSMIRQEIVELNIAQFFCILSWKNTMYKNEGIHVHARLQHNYVLFSIYI